ncbi:MAG: ethanolamine ammonia-lyase subunit EutC [Bacillota bacterium]|nr:ethanolamine ammonia-lyase subunit EutC [Bacillota bacterium]
MDATKDMEKLIVESVLQELTKRGVVASNRQVEQEIQKLAEELGCVANKTSCDVEEVADDGAELTIPDITNPWVPEPANAEALKAMKEATIARIGLWRAGPRLKTGALIRFLADHAVAQDAVFLDVSVEILKQMNLFTVETMASSKEDYLTRPELGMKLSEQAIKTIKEKCQPNVQVQIVVADGLSSTAIEANIKDVLPPLMQGLKAAGITVGAPFFVKYGRVRVMDEIGMLLNAEVVLELVGERPGLGTAESMSAYIIYKPTEKTVEADRTMISNIHRGGTPPAEAGAQLVDLVKQILAAKASGTKLTRS